MRLFLTCQGAEDLVEEKHVKNVLGFHEECFFCYKKHLQTNGKTGNLGASNRNPTCIHIEYRTRVPIYTLKIRNIHPPLQLVQMKSL